MAAIGDSTDDTDDVDDQPHGSEGGKPKAAVTSSGNDEWQKQQAEKTQPRPDSAAPTRGSKGWSDDHESGYQSAMREMQGVQSNMQSVLANKPATAGVTMPKPAPTFGTAGAPTAPVGGAVAALPRTPQGQQFGPPGFSQAKTIDSLQAAGQPNVSGGVVRNQPAGTAEQDYNTSTGQWVPKSAPSMINGRPAADVLAEGAAKTGTRPVYSGSGLNALPRPVGPTPPVGGTQAVMAPRVRNQTAYQKPDNPF